MKIITLFLACTFFITSSLQAGAVKEVYTSAQEEIGLYYQAGGEWELLKISQMEFIYKESSEFITLTANTTIRNFNTGKVAKENCIVTFVEKNLELYGINCF